jgi:plasmid stability protein
MRTTVDLDEDLLREVKRRAADSGRTMSETVRDLLRASLAAVPPAEKRPGRVKLITFSGKPEPGLQLDIDLNSNIELRDILDEAETATWREQTGYNE